MTTPRQALWQQAACDLRIGIETPCRLRLPDGEELEFDVLVNEFGSESGTLITDDATQIEPYVAVLRRMGYTITSYLQPPVSETYDCEDYIEVLREWGWCGREEDRPDWL